MDNYFCGGYYFSSNFDSGNLAKVELVKLYEGLLQSDTTVNAEVNVWTKPDCAGTEFENQNRSWFLFSIHGGEVNSTCKINVINLNKQTKLYSQGMHPVVRVGENGKWELTKDRPTYVAENDNFTLTFLHKNRNYVDVKYYYAFTFPFTYSDCQAQLDMFDGLYQRTEAEINFVMGRICDKKEKKEQKLGDIDTESNSNAESMWNQYFPVHGSHLEYIADKKNELKYMTVEDLECEIYYRRELLIRSFEMRNVDLLTITSFNGIQNEREDPLENLFPSADKPRCHKFLNKKIIFISSRVHPGETPASFVLNGFLKLLLDKKNIIAITLRKLYVFKIVPFLNPDGVYRGCYRSDTLGHNLNRVYLCPKLETQPSIYAVRKLIRYYHHGKDIQKSEDISSNHSTESNNVNDQNKFVEIFNDCQENQNETSETTPVFKENIQECTTRIIESTQSQSSSDSDASEEQSKSSNKTKYNSENDHNVGKVFHESFETEIKPVIVTPLNNQMTKTQSSILKTNDKIKTAVKVNQTPLNVDTKKRDHLSKSKTTKQNLLRKETKSSSSTNNLGQYRLNKRKETINLNISSDYMINLSNDVDSSLKEKSNMFLYIDLHGHASKKGVFMYGNHLPNTLEAVECMLLPRLMSLNSHHFHYDGCVFSERNMYQKGKRDGLSKEGSGRVAIYKTIGLIKSYTLESNYNTGKYVNLLPPKGKETFTKKQNLTAPKYTPAIFEEVGRALGPSILDLTSSNPQTRLHNSEYKSLQGLRNSLRYDIDKSNRSIISTKVSSLRSKRGKNPVPCCSSSQQDVLKENKGKSSSIHIKHSTLFGKKENSTTRKKGKILCDVLSAGTKFQEPQTPVPVKRPKVTKKSLTNLESTEFGGSIVENVPKKNSDGSTNNKLNKTIDTVNAGSSIDLSIYYDTDDNSLKKYQNLPNSNVIDAPPLDNPCCSHSLPRNMINLSLPRNKKSATFSGLSSSSSNLSATQIKKPTSLKVRSKYSNASLLKQLKRSSMAKDSLKLKKKKLLKSDTNLKRKKSRVF